MMRLSVNNKDRAVGYWVFTGTIMLVIQVLLGGITRLTGSGLSITEWDVITGALPPLHHAQWLAEFSKYQATPQYKLMNAGFSLDDFKAIFFWEWFHRLWARLVGVVFIAGFAYLVWQKKMKAPMIMPLLILFLLGAFQGAIGWIMVASGLTGDAIYVKPAKLALHFIFALGLISYAWWFTLQLLIPQPGVKKRTAVTTVICCILSLLTVQLLYGALMAGFKAAAVAPTWPDINGDMIPASLFSRHPVWLNFFQNTITIHFIHRLLAYGLLIATLGWSIMIFRRYPGLRSLAILPLSLILIQVLLGITAVLSSPGIVANHWVFFDWIALLHQLTALLFLLCMVFMLYVFQRR